MTDNLAIFRLSSSMMSPPFDLFGGVSQCSAEVVFPNMPLRGWATSRWHSVVLYQRPWRCRRPTTLNFITDPMTRPRWSP